MYNRAGISLLRAKILYESAVMGRDEEIYSSANPSSIVKTYQIAAADISAQE